MDALLFQPEVRGPAKYMDPGDIVRSKHHRMRTPVNSPKREREVKKPYRPNPFRQPIADPLETEFRHSLWQQQRDIVRKSLAAAGKSGHALERFDNCGAECVVEWSDSLDRYRLRASYCRCRHCQPCAKQRGSLIAANLRAKLEAGVTNEGDRFRFITLTLRHSDAALAHQVKDLYTHFAALRRSKFWKRSQRGGAAVLEVGVSKTGQWHPHLHIFSEGDFVRQDKLANEWMRLTKGSFKVDVRKLENGKHAAAYVSKYVAKGCPDAVWADPQKASEWICATNGLRTCMTYGTWRGYRLMKPDALNDAKDWRPVGLLSRIMSQALAGSLADLNLWYILENAMQYDPSRRHSKVIGDAGNTLSS